jgi:hypothetical protein
LHTFFLSEIIGFTAKTQSAQRIFILCLPLSGRQTERTTRTILKKLLMLDGMIIVGDPIARKACFFNFLPLLASYCYLAGVNRKLKEKSLCALCDSSEAGGESMSKQ